MYLGRFAPSPTGPLHLGSLVAAVGSYLEAKSNQGQWLVRMEDLDPPREQPGAASQILRTLENCGFEWDGTVLYQSQRYTYYETALQQLMALDMVYPCTCSRKEIQDSALMGIEGMIYSGICRNTPTKPEYLQCSWRLKTSPNEVIYTDMLRGIQSQSIARDIGDFILKRSDGLYAYQLGVVVDDAAQGITHVVRGADLLASTPRQIYLQQLLGYITPQYAHLPVVVNQQGEKLSKQTLARPLDTKNTVQEFWTALNLLGQNPPAELCTASQQTLWDWAHLHWRLDAVPSCNVMIN